jgi:hypothetical protein
VKTHHLEEGDHLVLYRNQQGNYVSSRAHGHSFCWSFFVTIWMLGVLFLTEAFNAWFQVLRGKKKVHSESKGAPGLQQKNAHSLARGFPEAPSNTEEAPKERDFGVGLEDRSGPKVKAEPTVIVGDDDPFFKEDLMRNINSSFGPGLLQPLERFPSLNLDFALDEIMAGIPKVDNETDNEPNSGSPKVAVVPKTEPAG